MSIHDFANKIKRGQGIGKEALIQILVLVIVAIGSYYLGKISNIKLDNNNVDIVNTIEGEEIKYIK